MFCRLYRAACRRFGPEGMTLSACAHLRAEAGKPFWRNRIDGFCLLFRGQHQHCESSYQSNRPKQDPNE
jgi:hypothetical protein